MGKGERVCIHWSTYQARIGSLLCNSLAAYSTCLFPPTGPYRWTTGVGWEFLCSASMFLWADTDKQARRHLEIAVNEWSLWSIPLFLLSPPSFLLSEFSGSLEFPNFIRSSNPKMVRRHQNLDFNPGCILGLNSDLVFLALSRLSIRKCNLDCEKLWEGE